MALGAEGTVEEDEQIELYFAERAREAFEHFFQLLEEAGLSPVSERIIDRDWNEEWEKSFPPVHIGNELVIKAPFHPEFPDHAFVIEVNPERAFGTGHHPTTRLMLEQLLQMQLEGASVLDMGCGTGILSILCEKKGASAIRAVDNDEWAVRNCVSTIEQNGCQRIRVEYGASVPWRGTRSDVILGNIERTPLLGMIPDMVKGLSPGGALLLSGLRRGDIEPIHHKCQENRLKAITRTESDGWSMLKYQKPLE